MKSCIAQALVTNQKTHPRSCIRTHKDKVSLRNGICDTCGVWPVLPFPSGLLLRSDCCFRKRENTKQTKIYLFFRLVRLFCICYFLPLSGRPCRHQSASVCT